MRNADDLHAEARNSRSQSRSGQTLQATALVHDAYIRLMDMEKARYCDSRGYFFAAAVVQRHFVSMNDVVSCAVVTTGWAV